MNDVMREAECSGAEGKRLTAIEVLTGEQLFQLKRMSNVQGPRFKVSNHSPGKYQLILGNGYAA